MTALELMLFRMLTVPPIEMVTRGWKVKLVAVVFAASITIPSLAAAEAATCLV